MSTPMIGMVVLVVVLLSAVVALSYRLWKLRQGGTAAIMRDLPAVGGVADRLGGVAAAQREVEASLHEQTGSVR